MFTKKEARVAAGVLFDVAVGQLVGPLSAIAVLVPVALYAFSDTRLVRRALATCRVPYRYAMRVAVGVCVATLLAQSVWLYGPNETPSKPVLTPLQRLQEAFDRGEIAVLVLPPQSPQNPEAGAQLATLEITNRYIDLTNVGIVVVLNKVITDTGDEFENTNVIRSLLTKIAADGRSGRMPLRIVSGGIPKEADISVRLEFSTPDAVRYLAVKPFHLVIDQYRRRRWEPAKIVVTVAQTTP